MDRNGIPTLLLFSSLILIFCNFSNATSLISTIRRLADVKNNSSGQIQVSPSPSPADPVKINPTINTTEVDNKSKGDNSTKSQTNNNNNNNNTEIVGPISTMGNEKGDMARENEKRIERLKERSKSNEPEVWENCTEVSRRCTDQKSMTACILNFDAASKKCLILIQNAGEYNLSVSVSAPNPIDDSLIEIEKHKSKKFNLTVGERTEVILNAKHGECVLHLASHVSQDNLFVHLPSYDQLITPINGAYFLIIVVVFGGTCAFCMFRRRRQGGIAYQELEMSVPESGIANDAETRRGWDQDWDDDWDEENAIKSPAARHSASISANGLTSRSQNKDGWDNNWDD